MTQLKDLFSVRPKRKPMRYQLLFLCLLLLLAVGCEELSGLEDIEDINYEAEFAFPLVNTQVGMQDLLDQLNDPTAIRVDADGLLHFEYEGEVFTQQSLDVLQEVTDAIPPVIPVLTDRFALPFSVPGQIDIDELTFRSGTLSYTLQNRNPEPVSVTVTLPQIQVDGAPITYSFSLDGFTGSGVPPTATNQDQPTDLSDARVIPQNDTVYIEYEAITPQGEQVSLSNFLLQINDPNLSYAEGYLGQNTYEGGSDRITIDFFDLSYIDGTVSFADPTLTFFVDNSFGIPTLAQINNFAVITVEGNRLPVESDLIDSGIPFPYPPLDAVGESRTGAYVFDRENSNIVDLLSSNPLAIEYDIDVVTHPSGDVSQTGFLTDQSDYSIRLAVDLPLEGQISAFLVRDTVDLSLGELEEVEEAEFKIVADNSIPVDADLQSFFLSEQGTVLDSLLVPGQQRIQGAAMNPDGLSTSPVTTELIIPYPADRFATVREATRIILSVRLSTDSNAGQNVRIFDQQNLAIRIGVIARVRTD